jgi:lipopolysaccharide/colanic/teichoic acid biosynthesis glycosyltransferase
MKAAVVLAGCGVFNGTEIHQAVMTLYAIDRILERLDYDLLFLENVSLYLDLKIIFYTLNTILKRKGI